MIDASHSPSAFSIRIRQLRGHAMLTQQQLARATGIGRVAISNIERGAAKVVSMDFVVGLCRWAATNNYSVVWLTTGQGDMLSPQPATQGDQP